LEETSLHRKAIAALAAAVLACIAPPWSQAHAEYPDRPIKIICTYAAGGGGDLMVRWYANGLRELTGKPVTVENKVGASGHLGNQAAMDARPDGYTMIITGASAWVGNPLLMKGIDYDPMTALAPVTTLNELGLILVVNPKLPIHSVADLTAFIKAKNGKALYGVQTSSALVATNLYLQKIGAEATRVAYKSAGDAASDIAAGLIDFYFPDATLAMSQAAQGRVRMLASTPAKRVSVAPDLPTMQEAGVPGFEVQNWQGLVGPAHMPPAIVKVLNETCNKALADPEIRKQMLEQGNEIGGGTPEQFAAFIRSEAARWGQVVKTGHIKPE